MTVSINGTSGLVFNDASTQATAATGFGFKNRIINGAMMIDQRNAGASVTVANTRACNLDRWITTENTDGSATVQQVTDAPAGFTNSLKITVTGTDTSLSDTQYFDIQQRIEGFNIADLGWGTANAAPVTLSFWTRSSVTGTFGGSLHNDSNRSYPFTYSINSADTWEYKTVTISGSTTGTWGTTNGKGIFVNFGLGVGSTYSGTAGSWQNAFYVSATGSTNLIATNGATFYITGVQLEKGSTATSFDYRPYGTELSLCQRYYYRANGVANIATMPRTSVLVAWSSSAAGNCYAATPVSMRSAPTFNSSGLQIRSPNLGSFAATFSGVHGSVDGIQIEASGSSGLTTDSSYFVAATGTASYYELSAEL